MNGVPYFGLIGAFTYNLSFFSAWLWAIECYAMLWGGVGLNFPRKKELQECRNIISIKRVGGVKF